MSEIVHVMLDLETMGTGPGAPIVAIGAQAFTGSGLIESDGEFYGTASLASALEHCAGDASASAILWWLQQPDDVRMEVVNAATPLQVVLDCFLEWFSRLPADREMVRVWGNGASFDLPILASALQRWDEVQPWRFKHERCYRTLCALFPTRPKPSSVHHALQDARMQARHVVALAALHAERGEGFMLE